MLREEIKQLKTEPSDLRKFGLLVGGALILLGLWFWHRHKGHYPWFLFPGSILLIAGVTLPRSLKQIYIGWMAMAFVLGLVVSTVLLTAFFYLVVTPIGLAARCFGKDFLERKWDSKAPSYWLARDQSKPRQSADYDRQF
jgi:polyferredoxin